MPVVKRNRPVIDHPGDERAIGTFEIQTEGGRPLTLPFDRETVPTVDLAAGHLVVEPPAELLPGAGS